jgi:hypothetical protein
MEYYNTLLHKDRLPIAIPNIVLSRTTNIFPFTRVGNDWQGRNNPVVNSLGEWVMIWVEATNHSDVGTNWRCNIAFSDDEGTTWSDNNEYLDGSPVTGFPLSPHQSPATAISDFQVMKCPNGDLVIIGQERGVSTGTWNDTNVTQSQFRSTDDGKTWAFDYDFSVAIGFTTTANKAKIQGNYENTVVGNSIYLICLEVNTSLSDSRVLFVKSTDNAATWQIVSHVTEYGERTYAWTEVSPVYLGGTKFGALASQNGTNFNTVEYRESPDLGATWGSVTDLTAVVGYTGICQPRTFIAGSNLVFAGRDNKRYFYEPLQSWNDRNSFWTTPLNNLFSSTETKRYYLDPYYAGVSTSALQQGDAGYLRLFLKEDGNFVFFGYYGTSEAATIYKYEIGHTTTPSTEHYANNNFLPETITPNGIRLQCNRDNISASPTAASNGGIAIASRQHNTLATSDVWLNLGVGAGTTNELYIDSNGIGWLQLIDGHVFTNIDLANLICKASFSIGFWLWPNDGQAAAAQQIVWTNSDTNTTLSDGLSIVITTAGKILCRYSENGTLVTGTTLNAVFANGAVAPKHIACTITSGNLIRIYVDGVLETLDPTALGDMSTVTMASFNCANYISFGRRRTTISAFDSPFIGKIREIIMQPVVWSAGDITNIMLN